MALKERPAATSSFSLADCASTRIASLLSSSCERHHSAAKLAAVCSSPRSIDRRLARRRRTFPRPRPPLPSSLRDGDDRGVVHHSASAHSLLADQRGGDGPHGRAGRTRVSVPRAEMERRALQPTGHASGRHCTAADSWPSRCAPCQCRSSDHSFVAVVCSVQQIWRLLTCFLLFGPISMKWVMTVYMMSAQLCTIRTHRSSSTVRSLALTRPLGHSLPSSFCSAGAA